MTIQKIVNTGAVAFGLIAAGLWFWSAVIPASYPMAYIGGPPQEVINQMNLQACLNAVAAACTAFSVLLSQVVSPRLLPKNSN